MCEFPNYRLSGRHAKTGSFFLIARLLLFSLFAVSCETRSTSPFTENDPPVFTYFFISEDDSITIYDTLNVSCQVSDPDRDLLTVNWWSSGGIFITRTDSLAARWHSAGVNDNFIIGATVADEWGHRASRSDTIYVGVPTSNRAPIIQGFSVNPSQVTTEDTVLVHCQAIDVNEGDSLRYQWTTNGGILLDYTLPQVRWIAPKILSDFFLKSFVSDGLLTVSDSVVITVHPSPLIMDFSTDQVTQCWTYEGLLAGLGSELGPYSIEWEETAQAMAILGVSNYGTFGFRLIGKQFNDGVFSIKVKVTNYEHPRVCFIPKFIDISNYFLIGINFFQGSCQVLRCQNGTVQYLAEDWRTYSLNEYHEIKYEKLGNLVICQIDKVELWRSDQTNVLNTNSPLGVGIYSLEDADPALFDDLLIEYQ